MLNVNEHVTVFYPGEQLPQITNDSVKIYLGGTMDFSGNIETDWQQAFIDGLAKLTDPLKGLLLIKNLNFIIFNPKVPLTGPAGPTLDNPEFVKVMSWRMQMQELSDMVFINIMKNSVAPFPLIEFGSLLTSGKLIVRSSELNQAYSHIRLYCEKYQVPLLTGKTSVKDVILAAGGCLEKFRDNARYPLPEQ